jgi:uncharacterized protein
MDTDLIFAGPAGPLPALLRAPAAARALFVFGHGAGAGMRHRFMAALAAALAERSLATFRYEFPYMAAGSKRPDRSHVLEATVHAAVRAAAAARPDLPLFAGGKSMGGRMTSRAQAAQALPGVRGLIFVGFPLHPPKQLGTERADHLDGVQLPLLFLQGTRDDLADLELIRGVTARLGARATLYVLDGADHSFAVLKRSGRTDAELLAELADTIATWTGSVLPGP